jgi:hypothetical protein
MAKNPRSPRRFTATVGQMFSFIAAPSTKESIRTFANERGLSLADSSNELIRLGSIMAGARRSADQVPAPSA